MARLVLLLVALLSLVALCVAHRSLHVDLHASWRSTPLLLEASEFAASHSEAAFWRFVEAVAQSLHSTTGQLRAAVDGEVTDAAPTEHHWHMSDEAQVDVATLGMHAALELSEGDEAAATLAMFRYALGLRYYSPLLASHADVAATAGSEFTPEQIAECARATASFFPSWTVVGGKLACSAAAVMDALLHVSEDAPQVRSFSIDHSYDAAPAPSLPHVVLYGDVRTRGFLAAHSLLKDLSTNGRVRYTFRHDPHHALAGGGDDVEDVAPVLLQGYGAEMNIKSMEYKAMDDSAGIVNEETEWWRRDLRDPFLDVAFIEKDREDDDRPSDEELADGGARAGLIALQAGEGLSGNEQTLAILDRVEMMSQNFPSFLQALSKEVSEEEARWFQVARRWFGPGKSSLYLNGVKLDILSLDPFRLFKAASEEMQELQRLRACGLSPSAARDVLQQMLAHQSDGAGAGEIRVAVASPENKPVHFFNDLRTDEMYARWPSGIAKLLEPSWPGQLRFIRENFLTMITVLDPLDFESIHMFSFYKMFLEGSAPLRLGLVLHCPTTGDAREDTCRLFVTAFELLYARSPLAAISFGAAVADAVEAEAGDVTAELLEASFPSQYGWSSVRRPKSASAGRRYLRSAASFVQSKGLEQSLPVLFLNGRPLRDLHPQYLQHQVMSMAQYEYHVLQQMIMHGMLRQGDDIHAKLLETLEAAAGYYPTILDQHHVSFLPLQPGRHTDLLASSHFLNDDVALAHAPALHTHVLLADLTTSNGREQLLRMLEAVEQQREECELSGDVFEGDSEDEDEDEEEDEGSAEAIRCSSRFALLLPHASSEGADALSLSSLIALASTRLPPPDARAFLRELVHFISDGSRVTTEDVWDLLPVSMEDDAQRLFVEACQTLPPETPVRLPEKLQKDVPVLLTNGRIIELSQTLDRFGFAFLERYEWEQRAVDVIRTALAQPDEEHAMLYLVSSLNSLISTEEDMSYYPAQRRVKLPSPLELREDGRDVMFELSVVLDPISKHARKVIPIIKDFMRHFGDHTRLSVVLNPSMELSANHMASYYRYAVQSELRFDAQGSLVPSGVTFSGLPESRLFTLTLDTLEAWLTQPSSASFDLDNIFLESGGGWRDTHAHYALEHILIQGSCYEKKQRSPPRGLEVTTGKPGKRPLSDTIVMANYGYFQLKANPGVWEVKTAGGRSSVMYRNADHSETQLVSVSSYSGHHMLWWVERRDGFEDEKLLDLDESVVAAGADESGVQAVGGAQDDETIHVFSMASGHLYERFMKIMMLSVVKNTNSPVKFWFLKNFLSPAFKEYIPKFAEKYGFQFEMITYQWPTWLHQQTEKQRVIWGYKILFLDVLFPLSIKKIIYVDADQVVRADLKELVDLDLHGAPYGYTPFCDSRTEMDGFRFWKTGYWESHLRDKPYHISALYVVDLERFRRIAAGDQLRATYDSLSSDPNSLSNLDQDLPNYMQHSLPIFSLPQEWLWCETWCSDESKAEAKTIDLCNNPLTKTPKLENAARIIPDWLEMDQEAKEVLL